ncbi:hypothetical protein C1646_711176 [Rhizophagus diaphanus]|nr:hypothetical protein C1646_711176 [Rhizophagus diaphanus] [Rhizophagus sp. MUCL 43196]
MVLITLYFLKILLIMIIINYIIMEQRNHFIIIIIISAEEINNIYNYFFTFSGSVFVSVSGFLLSSFLQVQRSSTGILLITDSTCFPHPCQVCLLQVLQVTAKHIFEK